MLQRETVSHPGTRVVAVEIGDYARLDLQLGGTDIVYLLILDIFVLEVDTRGVGRRNDISVQHKRTECNDPCLNRVRQHQTPETHHARQHCDHF